MCATRVRTIGSMRKHGPISPGFFPTGIQIHVATHEASHVPSMYCCTCTQVPVKYCVHVHSSSQMFLPRRTEGSTCIKYK